MTKAGLFQTAPIVASGHLFLEQAIEASSNVVGGLDGCSSEGLIWQEEIAKIPFFAVWDPLGMRFAAPIVRRWIVVQAVQTAMDICVTGWTDVGARDGSLKLQFTFAGVADHEKFEMRNMRNAKCEISRFAV